MLIMSNCGMRRREAGESKVPSLRLGSRYNHEDPVIRLGGATAQIRSHRRVVAKPSRAANNAA